MNREYPALVNCCVVNLTSDKTVLPWSITVCGRICANVKSQMKWILNLQKIQGFSEQQLLALSLDSARPFLCYYTCDQFQQLSPMHNAFTVLMLSQRQLSLPSLPAVTSISSTPVSFTIVSSTQQFTSICFLFPAFQGFACLCGIFLQGTYIV